MSVYWLGSLVWVVISVFFPIFRLYHPGLTVRLPVPQRGPMGCGIACVAYIVGASYMATKSRYFMSAIVPVGDDQKRGYTRRALRSALKHAGNDVDEHRYRAAWSLTRDQKVDMIPAGSIILVERYHGDQERHYIVRAPSGWIDPLDPDEGIPSHTGQVRDQLPRTWNPLGFLVCLQVA
jgi:hypothetical protein